jgi:hypothetical protein
MKTNQCEIRQAWTALSRGERWVISAIMRVLKDGKASQSSEVAQAARRWEQGISFFIKVRLMRYRPQGGRRDWLKSSLGTREIEMVSADSSKGYESNGAEVLGY